MKNIAFKIDEGLLEKFRRYCESQHRSLRGEILWMIEETVKKYEKNSIDKLDKV